MSSNTGGNFCSVTGHPDWCSSKMQCDGSAGQCPVKHWCVCQWAFASYLQRAGGCDKIQTVVCEATNMVALTHYREQASRDAGVKAALECLEQRCLRHATVAEASSVTLDVEVRTKIAEEQR